jgi:hypothetical protein
MQPCLMWTPQSILQNRIAQAFHNNVRSVASGRPTFQATMLETFGYQKQTPRGIPCKSRWEGTEGDVGGEGTKCDIGATPQSHANTYTSAQLGAASQRTTRTRKTCAGIIRSNTRDRRGREDRGSSGKLSRGGISMEFTQCSPTATGRQTPAEPKTRKRTWASRGTIQGPQHGRLPRPPTAQVSTPGRSAHGTHSGSNPPPGEVLRDPRGMASTNAFGNNSRTQHDEPRRRARSPTSDRRVRGELMVGIAS